MNVTPTGDRNAGADNADNEVDSNHHNHDGEDNSTDVLNRLTAHVIESSNTFYSILRHVPRNASFDMAATMLILTNYMRLTQLHLTLYALIQSTMPPCDSQSPIAATNASPYPTQRRSQPSTSFNATVTSMASTTPTAPRSSTSVPFPYLQIGGVSLAAYPRFQLKFILQICVHHLGEVELLLGLPAELCVSGGKRSLRHGSSDGEDDGILHRNTVGTTLLVRTIMMEASGTVKEIRQVLMGLTDELRASIQI